MDSFSTQQTIDEFLRVEIGLCPYCISLVVSDDGDDNHIAITQPSMMAMDDSCSHCSLCFGLSSLTYQEEQIAPLIIKSLTPYCEGRGNYITKETPTLNLPLLIAVRAHCAVAAAECFINTKQTITDTASPIIRLRSTEDVYSKLKEYIRSSIRDVLEKTITLLENNGETKCSNEATQPNLSQQLHEEESGYLAAHVLVLPQFGSADVSNIIPPSLQVHINKHKHQIVQSQNRILNPRKRFRGNDPTLKQGGEPRTNLELRVRRSMSQAPDKPSMIAWLEKSIFHEWLRTEIECKNSSLALSSWLQEAKQHTLQPSVHVGIWRRPFYVRGTYTKSRRDVAQTPFYVSDAKSGLVRKGFSSVEEEICPRLANCCGGISTLNNEHVLVTDDGEAVVQEGSVVYGCCKFHASGREDLDVRMLLPPPSIVKSSSSDKNITGRPFVCEIFDAFRLPTATELEIAVKAINQSSSDDCSKESIVYDSNGWPQSLVGNGRFHGCNPNGVGVSSPLELTSSSSFSGLQAETEEKVKHYACICWTSVIIRSDKELIEKLGCLPWDKEEDSSDFGCDNFPLEIKQDTPLRVLHRRSSDTRTKTVLSLSARRISDHWIHLRMATSGGTYVKEFCNGDLGRTQPSISTMLGGRVDITELDCLGIVM
jgi:hypothetical protein